MDLQWRERQDLGKVWCWYLVLVIDQQGQRARKSRNLKVRYNSVDYKKSSSFYIIAKLLSTGMAVEPRFCQDC